MKVGRRTLALATVGCAVAAGGGAAFAVAMADGAFRVA